MAKAFVDDLPLKLQAIAKRDRPEFLTIPDIVRSDERVAEDRRQLGEFILKTSILALTGDKLVVVRYTDESGGEWTLPGGLVEPSESVEEGAIREAKEETGPDVELGQAAVIIRSRITAAKERSMGYFRVVFKASVIGGRPIAADKHEIAEVRLATWKEIATLVSSRKFQSMPTQVEEVLLAKLHQFSNQMT